MYKEVPTAFTDTQYDQKPDKLYKKMVLGNNLYSIPTTNWNKDKYLIFKYSLHLYEIIIISVFGTIVLYLL